ncbi:pilus assembly FimT family protein [Coraliomargarita akajimensis]|uniref:Prepilin-type N-terminal cleavage/methylation domain-containing protein n=1 Tax=Coraliomargarita akajimensis (strain DSM 45221 / IAM 15411 / JCM 23193 / KCTC 12865 / 04OKA010-24) TaxID=583355 RepID=D5EQH2_CORAD|nr:prepilin-type N-terminal cleavage/methylation domain-containing protein [Coraliomargarita akajimensis]ADE55786.1 conserved hypothetical protein [Coraliomargarita akajimensis DSM 45221]
MRIQKSPRSGFTLIELLTVIAIIGILAAILIPTVGAVRQKASMITSSSNLKQIAIGYNSFSNSGTRTRVIKSEGTGNFSASTPEKWAEVVSKYGDLNDATVYFISSADDVTLLDEIPKIILDTESAPVQAWTNATQAISYAMGTNISPNAGASTTPLIWTKGLDETTGEWAPDSPWLGKGGHIAFLDGHVEYFEDLLGDDGTSGALIDPTSGSPTKNIKTALGANGVIVENE